MKLLSHLLLITVVLLSGTTEFSAQNRRPARTGVTVSAPAPPPPARTTPEAKRRLESFNKAWSILSEYYFDRTFNKLDWNKIRLEYEPKVRAAKTDAEFHSLLGGMIARLGRSHLAIIPPEVYRAIETAKIEARVREARRAAEEADKETKDETAENKLAKEADDPLTQYGIGVDLRILDGQFVITSIEPGSTAERAGLKTGYVIEKVNSVGLRALLKSLETSGVASPPMKRQLIYQVITGFINGDKDSEVALSILDENNAARDFSVKREKLHSQVISLLSGLPERHLNFEKRAIGEDIGYIHFDYFAVPVIDQFCEAVGDFRNKKGLVIDLRGNFGGLLATMPTFAGMLSQEKIDLGTSIYRNNAERLIGWPKVKNFKGKIVFLIDSHSTSAAEIFAAAMQESGRAFLVGDHSPGEALPSLAVELPTGAVLQYPIANFRTSAGKYLEGKGVTPDFPVPLTRAGLLQGKDLQLEKAVELLRGNKEPVRHVIANTSTVPEFLSQITSSAGPPQAGAAPPSAKIITVKPPANDTKAEERGVIDPHATKLIDDYLAKIGGKEAIGKIETYSLIGESELYVKGTRNELKVEIYRDGPAKYAEILTSPSSGEIREIHNGKTITIQSDYGLTQEIPKFTDVVDTDLLGPIRSMAKSDYFASLKYHGVFDRNGKKVHLVDGRSKDGMMIALAFDVKSGLLVSFTGAYYGMNFGDYEKAGELLLPHTIERERIMTMTLEDIEINKPIDPSKFAKKLKCYDIDK